ncbi:MAG TPA: hypothetical protein VK837_10525 [Longimicrobiales bacterium]|nr:hypothetical protein [Longimicrobiales bacterium]
MSESNGNGRNRVAQAIILGALAVAALDILDAFVFFGVRGVAPVRILQNIASGVLGREAFSGGVLGVGVPAALAARAALGAGPSRP